MIRFYHRVLASYQFQGLSRQEGRFQEYRSYRHRAAHVLSLMTHASSRREWLQREDSNLRVTLKAKLLFLKDEVDFWMERMMLLFPTLGMPITAK